MELCEIKGVRKNKERFLTHKTKFSLSNMRIENERVVLQKSNNFGQHDTPLSYDTDALPEFELDEL